MERIEALAAQIRKKADAFVLIGVGGSNNAARVVIEAIAPEDSMKIVYAGNTLSADSLNRVLKSLDGHEVYINCIAKNFGTLEPGVSFRILRQYLVQRYGKEEAARRILWHRNSGQSAGGALPERGIRVCRLSAEHRRVVYGA